REIIVASNGKDSVVMARGKFSVTGLESAQKSNYKGLTIYGQGDGGFTFLDKTTAVAGNARAIRSAIDQKQTGSHAAAGLVNRAQAISAQNQVWAVSSGWGSFLDQVAP